MHGFCPRSSASAGFELDPGRRASSTSTITSCDGISAVSSRSALVM
jgi:hypothetical protein